MAKIGSMFPGQYLKAADLQGKAIAVVIDSLEVEEIGSEPKPVLHFKGKDRGLVLNKTNASTIEEILGTDETDEWPGKSIVLYPSKTDYQGKRVDCIRVKADPRHAPPAPEPEPEFEDEVPF